MYEKRVNPVEDTAVEEKLIEESAWKEQQEKKQTEKDQAQNVCSREGLFTNNVVLQNGSSLSSSATKQL